VNLTYNFHKGIN